MRDLKTLGRHYTAVLQKTAPLLHRVHPGVLKKKKGHRKYIKHPQLSLRDQRRRQNQAAFVLFHFLDFLGDESF